MEQYKSRYVLTRLARFVFSVLAVPFFRSTCQPSRYHAFGESWASFSPREIARHIALHVFFAGLFLHRATLSADSCDV